MYEFLPPVARYALLAILYLFLFLLYRGLCRAVSAPSPVGTAGNGGGRVEPATLTVVSAGPTSSATVGQQVPLLTQNTLGRGSDCTLAVEDQYASKLHAAVEVREGVYVLVDLGSRNGTMLNGAALSAPTELLPGDRIQIGTTVLEFRE